MRYFDPGHSIIITADGRCIPADLGNVDYAGLVAAGTPIRPFAEPLPTADDVRAECSRRMRALVGARDATHLRDIISNAEREAARLNIIRSGIPGVLAAREWTAAEVARATALHAADAAIEALRAASNILEPNPPTDYTSDAHWRNFG